MTHPLSNITAVKIPITSSTTGYLIFGILSIILFILASEPKDTTLIIFAVPLIFVLALGSSQDKTGKGNVDSDLQAVGWSTRNTHLAVPLGIASGIIALFLGSTILEFAPGTASFFTLDMTASLQNIAPAAIIPSALAIAVSIYTTFMIVAPSEETIKNILAPYAAMSIFKSTPIAYILGNLIWVFYHLPTYISQGVPDAMYIVLILLGSITTILYFITKSIMASILAHATFNSGVIIMSNNINPATYYLLAIILIILSYAWVTSLTSKKNTRRAN